MAFWNKIKKINNKSNHDMSDIEETVVDAIIKVCYAYETKSYIESLENIVSNSLTIDEKKALDPVLSCLSLGVAVRYLRNKYENRSEIIIKKILNRLHTAVLSVTDSSEDIADLYVELVSNYSHVLDYDSVDVIDYAMGVCENVFEPVQHLFDHLKPTPSVASFILIFITGFGSKINVLIKKAEEKYQYIPSDK